MTTKRAWPLLVVPLTALLACVHGRADETTTAPVTPAWDDAPVVGATVADEGPALAADLAADDPARSLAALDRVVDLFDAARFAGDPKALDTMWLGLGDPLGPSRGPEATADAVNRLLQAAWRIEDSAPALSADARRFLNDTIALLSVDLNVPASADDLSIQTSAYRELAEGGHPRVADNARWRLYDHVRGVLEGAAEAAPERRLDVAVHALYAQQSSVTPLLERARGDAAALPPPEALAGLLDEQREALLAAPRWRPVVQARSERDAALQMTAITMLPVPRDPAWSVPSVGLGVGRPDSLAPVVWARPAGVVVDPGHPDAAAVSAHTKQLVDRLAAATAADGRATVLLVAPGDLPSPDFSAIRRGAVEAELATLEVAVREPDGTLTALPVQVVGPRGGLAEQTFASARIVLSLQGRGLRASADGAWIPGYATSGAEVDDLLERLRRAYPRERVVALHLDPAVQPRQLVDLLAAAIGGETSRFAAAGWLATGLPTDLEPDAGRPQAAEALAVRASLWAPAEPEAAERGVALDQAYPLPGDDQQRLVGLGQKLARCLPELERRGAAVEVRITFEEGRAKGHDVRRVSPRPAKEARAAFSSCVDEALDTFRLRQQRDAVTVGVELTAPPGS